MADIYDWNNPGQSSFGNASNWTNEVNGTNNVPTPGNVGNVINGGTAIINGTDNFAVDEFWAGNSGTISGNAGTGNLLMNAGSLTCNNWLVVGRGGATGSATMGGGTINVGANGGNFIVGDGNSAQASFTMNGGTITNTNEFWVGNGNSAVGTFNMSAGSITVGTWFAVGRFDQSQGTFNLSGGTVTKSTAATAQNENGQNYDFGRNTTGSAAIIGISSSNNLMSQTGGAFTNTVSPTWVAETAGARGTWTISAGTADFGILEVARYGNGTLNLSGTSQVNVRSLGVGAFDASTGVVNQTGGTLTVGGGDDIRIGGAGDQRDTNATGTFNLSGGTFNANNNFQIGANGRGTFNQTGGTMNSSGFVSVGRFVNSVGVVNVTGGSFNQTAGDRTLVAGEEGTGTISVGSATVNGVTTNGTINAAGGLLVGQANTGSGTFNLNAGGTLTTANVRAGVGTSTFNFDGGTLVPNASSATFFTGVQNTNVQAGGARINTAGFDVTVDQPLAHAGSGTDGGLIKSGAGVLTLTASSTYNGLTSVTGGTLLVTGALGAGTGSGVFNTSQGSVLGGTGTINTGANAITLAGTLSPGPTTNAGSTGTLGLVTTGDLTLSSTATLAFDITNAGTKDLITATGARLNLSGTLALSLGSGFDYAATYTLVSGLVGENGSFSSVTGYNSTQYTPRFSLDGSNYNLSFTAVPEPSTWTAGLLAGAIGLGCLRRRTTNGARS